MHKFANYSGPRYSYSMLRSRLNKNKRTKTEPNQSFVLPVIREEVKIGKRTIETGITRIRKVIRETVEEVDQPLREDNIQIERVVINRFIDEPVAVREEADETIVPVIEEVLVVEKKLLLKEEVHIRKHTNIIHKPQKVALRREEVIVDHIDKKNDAKETAERGTEHNTSKVRR